MRPRGTTWFSPERGKGRGKGGEERREEEKRGGGREGEERRGGGGREEATVNVRYLTRYMLQNVSYNQKCISSILPTNQVSATINKCQVLYHT